LHHSPSSAARIVVNAKATSNNSDWRQQIQQIGRSSSSRPTQAGSDTVHPRRRRHGGWSSLLCSYSHRSNVDSDRVNPTGTIVAVFGRYRSSVVLHRSSAQCRRVGPGQ